MARYSLTISNPRAGLMEVGGMATIIFDAADDPEAAQIGPLAFELAIADCVIAEIWSADGRQVWEKACPR